MEKDSGAKGDSTGTPVAFQKGALATSTPFDGNRGTSFGSTSKKADVSQLFQNIGSKLGWFDHGDLDMALKKLSKSSKKKTNKSKLEKDIDDSKERSSNSKEGSSKRSTKEKHKKSTKLSSNKENEKQPNQVKSSKRDTSPFKVIKNNDSLDDFKEVPLERKPGQTDLTSRSQKKSVKVKNDSSSLSTSDSQSESPSFDFGKPIKESTRIHSRKSIDNILDVTNISEVSTDKSVDNPSNSGDDSYKQLHINQRKPNNKGNEKCSVDEDICVGLQSLDIQAQKTDTCSSKGNNSNNSDVRGNQLYVTALEKSSSDESVGDHTRSSNMGFSNLKDKTLYLEYESTSKRGDRTQYLSMSESNSDSLNSNSSYFEVKDVSVQVGQEEERSFQMEMRNCSRLSESSSVIEVKDVSQQTSLSPLSSGSELSADSNFPCENNENLSQKLITENIIDNSKEVLCNSMVDNSSSFVQVQDTSTQAVSVDSVSAEVKNDTSDVSSADVKMADKTQYFDFSNNSVRSGRSKGSNDSVNSEYSASNKINETKYFSDDGAHTPYNIDNECGDVTKCFSDSDQLYDQSGENDVSSKCNNDHENNVTKSFSDSDQFNLDQNGENDYSSKHDIDQDNNIIKSFSDSDQLDSLPEQTRYFSGDNEHSRSLNSGDNQECNNAEVSNGSDQKSNMQNKTKYFDFDSDENVFSENEEPCKENVNLLTGKISVKRSSPTYVKTKSNFVEISSDEELPCDVNRNKAKKSHKNSVSGRNQRKPSSTKHLVDSDLDDSLPDSSVKDNSPKWRKTNGYHSDSSSSDDNLEQFFQKMKTPAKTKKNSSDSSDRHNNSMADFIVNDSDISSDDEDDDCFYLSTNSKLDLDRKNESVYIIDDGDDQDTEDSEDSMLSSSSDSDTDFKKDKPGTFVKPAEKNVRPEKTVTSREREKFIPREKTTKYSTSVHRPVTADRKYGFLKSLSSDLPEDKRDPEALRYVQTFKKTKDELLKKLFLLYNETVFDNKLPKYMEIVWNKRLLQTAGYCTYKRNIKNHAERSVRLEMSVKVCDTPERVRDTLIHELCHAAVWLLNGKSDGHGPYWKYWARKANLAHPELPVIARCHNYQITYKYTYVCSQCGYSIGRHSKSLDTTRKVCGHCHGRFVLKNSNACSSSDTPANQPKTPRTPNRFAMFVKENYGSVKKADKNLKHKDVMHVLSKQFAEKNKIS